MKNKEILSISQALNQIKPDETNIRTSYWLSRNLRNLKSVVESFETWRTAATSDSWFKDFQTKANDDEVKAREEYKEQLDLLDSEFNTKLNEEVEVVLFKISINDLEIKPNLVPYLLDLIEED